MKLYKIWLWLLLSLSLAFCAPSQKKINQDNEKNPQYQYEKAVIAMKYGLTDEAIKYVNQALSLDPRHDKSYGLLGLIHLRKKEYAEAATAFEKSLAIRPDDTDTRNNLASACLGRGQKDKSLEEFQKSFALDNNAYAGYNLAKLYFEKNSLETALDYATKSTQKTKDPAPVYNLKGVILNQMGRYPEAVASFQAALIVNPADVNAGVNLGIAYINNKQLDKAREILEKTLPNIKDEALKNKVIEYLNLIKEAEK